MTTPSVADPSAARAGKDWPFALMLVLAVALAGWSYARFWPQAPALWGSLLHDRNAHYWAAQSVGLDLRQGQLLHLAIDVERMRIWGPLHPLLTGVVLAIGGTDYRLAVLTALAAWIGTAVLAFLSARRVAPRAGNLAGAVAALLVLASPAQQAFATDIMLEAPGACLSLAVVYTYLRLRQGPTRANARCCALALTFLFFLKYNYWILGLLAVGLVELARGRRLLASAALAGARRWGQAALPRDWLLAQLRHPLTYPLLVLAIVLMRFVIGGPFELRLGGRSVAVRSADTLATIACWVALARVLPWWFRIGRPWLRQRATLAATVVAWHAAPVAAWFLVPKRAALFFSYLSRDHGAGEAGASFLARLTTYADTLAADYHGGTAALAIVLGLVALACLLAPRLRPGGGIVLAFLLVAVSLTLLQPCCRSRFVHSWVALLWVAAGAGLAGAVQGWGTRLGRRTGQALAAGVGGALLILCVPAALSTGHAPEGGIQPTVPSALVLPERYLPPLDGTRRVVIASNLPLKFFAMWTYQERFRRTERVMTEVANLPADPQSFGQWAERGQCDAVVWIEVSPHSLYYAETEPVGAERLLGLVESQTCFTAAGRWDLPDLGCSVTVWRQGRSVAELER